MKFRLASSLPSRLHGPLRFGRACRGHELALRMVQLLVLIVVAALGAKFIAAGVALLTRAIAGFIA